MLCGRENELRTLLEFLDGLRDGGTSALVQVTGDAGVGKSTVLDTFAEYARDRGTTVLTVRAFRGAAERPLGVFGELLEDHFDLPLAAPSSPENAHRDVRSLLERLAADQPLVLILDDCHSYEKKSLKLLAHLLRKPPNAPVLLALGFRDRQACAGLRSLLLDRSRALPVARLDIHPLSEEDVQQLLAGAGTPTWRTQLYRESGGNPRYLNALLKERPWPGEQSSPLHANHDDIEFLAEFDGIDPLARHVADAAAVLGEGFDVALIATMLAAPEQEVLVALDSLIRRDLVRPAVHGTSFAFRHPVVCRAVYQSCELSRRIRLHELAGETLRERGASASQRAPHVQHSIRYGDLAGAELLSGAAMEIMANQPRTAASWLRTALQTLPGRDETRQRRAVALMALARALGISGELSESWDAMHHALRTLTDEQRDERAEAVAHLAAIERMLGARGSADVILRAEIAARGDDAGVPTAFLQLEMAHGELVRNDPESCHAWASKALAIARRHRHRGLEASCLGLLGKTDCALGDTASAAARLDLAIAILDGMLDDELPESLDAAVWIGWSEILLQRWYDAARHFDRAVESAVRTNNGMVLSQLLLGQVMALRSRGKLAEAQAAAGHAVQLAERSGCEEQLFTARARLCWANSYLGVPDEALSTVTEKMARESEVVVGWQGALALRLLAEARLLDDDPDGCLELAGIIGNVDLQVANAGSRVIWYELLVRAELDAGRPAVAAAWAERAQALISLTGQAGLGHLAAAQVLLATDPAAALPAARAAVAGITRTGATVDELRARVVLGVAMWHQGLTDEALRELRFAKAGLERAGATALAKRAHREQRRLAARRSRTAESPEPPATEPLLTRREQQIAELVRDGLTNRKISRRLSISEKTVEMHLTNLFGKLGVDNRTAVAAHVADLRLAATSAR